MDKASLTEYLERLDRALSSPTRLCIFGSGAFILLDEPGRTSLDLDVAAPYSQANLPDLERAADEAGLPVNPPEDYSGDHIEWVSAARLCLAPPGDTGALLWQGKQLLVVTVGFPDLIASKLIRYDSMDQSDIRYLMLQAGIDWRRVADAVERLPAGFRNDPTLRENLRDLQVDLTLWKES